MISAVSLGVAAAGILAFMRHVSTLQAEESAARHARVVVDAVFGPELRPRDLRLPIDEDRRRRLDRVLTSRRVEAETLRVTLSRPDGVVTYATEPSLIGRRAEPRERLGEALASTIATDVAELDEAGRSGEPVKVLRSYVPVAAGGARGVATVYQDYGPIAHVANAAFLPVAAILELALVVLYLLLVPVLARVSRRIQRQVAEIHRRAYYDELTGLPNRPQFRERLAGAIVSSPVVAVLLVDLDRFEEINEALGHDAGESLLRTLAERLRASLPEDVFLARVGEDELGLVATGTRAWRAEELARTVSATLEEPFLVDGVVLAVDATVGIAVFPQDGTDANSLIRCADVALHVAKDRRLESARYDADLDTKSAARLSLMSELRRAIDGDELFLHYQPQARLVDGEVRAVEALVRWLHPVRGLLGPAEFVPHAERTPVIRTLTRFVLEAGVRQLREWGEEGLELALAVNVTTLDLMDAAFPEEVAALLERERVNPARLELEITESVIMSDPDRVREVLQRLKRVGTGLAIDDFGTGYSSLAYLGQLPVDAIKIDRSFVLGMDRPADRAIVRSTTELAHNLGLRVVAEGVETREAWDELAATRCDDAQGYFVARPAAGEALPGVLAEWVSRAPTTSPPAPRARTQGTRRQASARARVRSS